MIELKSQGEVNWMFRQGCVFQEEGLPCAEALEQEEHIK